MNVSVESDLALAEAVNVWEREVLLSVAPDLIPAVRDGAKAEMASSPKNGTDVVLYLRVSTEEQAQKDLSIPAQRRSASTVGGGPRLQPHCRVRGAWGVCA